MNQLTQSQEAKQVVRVGCFAGCRLDFTNTLDFYVL